MGIYKRHLGKELWDLELISLKAESSPKNLIVVVTRGAVDPRDIKKISQVGYVNFLEGIYNLPTCFSTSDGFR